METKNWYAWIDLMPPKPDGFHVIGEILVGNPGTQGELCVKEPQGINPSILLLDLHLIQRPGMWPQIVTWIQCHYDKILAPHNPKYTDVEIFYDGISIATIKVEEVH
ncbi:hypothetical protein [Nitrosovibrio sp. Nv17]|uniref:hypothetical protein n=1 Tax=Nitrosovibrio sp. Nv17 TaxID=1855339 RepID=UPI000908880A|nr:hypothetical protein [Nitrosovibrio sp. Nv17]SFW26729.1 hypothetical protein SAMN05216414_11012 [Nitrosovibrio sp. Nv17]